MRENITMPAILQAETLALQSFKKAGRWKNISKEVNVITVYLYSKRCNKLKGQLF